MDHDVQLRPRGEDVRVARKARERGDGVAAVPGAQLRREREAGHPWDVQEDM